jgi:hypothetical protein
MRLHDLLNKLEAEEQSFLSSEVLAPVLAGRAVTVRIAGVVCRLRVDNEQFNGWAVLQPLSADRAHILRPAIRSEIQKYLQLLPAVHLLAVARTKQADERAVWRALPSHQGDGRFSIKQPVPVLLCEESVQPFDAIIARFDGQRFWYEQPNARRNPALAAYLREAFNEVLPPEQLSKKGLSREEREAYALVWRASEEAQRRIEEERQRSREARRRAKEEARRSIGEARLADALSHAQGRLLSFIERDDVYTVTYRVNKRTHTSTVRKDDLTVLTSGICLSGRDHDFDLTSVVGVMREAATIGM